MNAPRKHELVLGLYPNDRGLAFAVFNGPSSAVDWGVATIRGKAKNRQCLSRISVLFGQYQPIAVVVQDTSVSDSRRARRIRSLHDAIAVLAETQGIRLFSYPREQTLRVFGHVGCTTKQAIAEAVAKLVPAFGNYIPPARKVWENEHSRMGLFDAAALVMTFYQSQCIQN